MAYTYSQIHPQYNITQDLEKLCYARWLLTTQNHTALSFFLLAEIKSN